MQTCGILTLVMKLKSLWLDNFDLPLFAPLEGDTKTDVLIIGGGLTGLLCGDALRKAGVDSVVIEADRICHGVTGCTTAKITAQHGLVFDKILSRFGREKAQMYLKANLWALEQYRKLCKGIGCEFEEQDSWVYALDDRRKLEKEMRALEKIGASAELMDDLPLPFQTAGGIRFAHQAQFHPLKFAAQIAKDLKVFDRTKALSYEGMNAVVTNRGRIRAEKIIVATHFPIFNKHGSYFLKMYQQRSYVLALDNCPRLNGMYVDESGKGLSFRNHGHLLLLGGGSHRTGKTGGNWEVLRKAAARYYPQSREQGCWATQDCVTLDEIPYIGQYSKNTPSIYVATGFNKWGMTSAMVSAMILSDLIQGRENPYAELFSPSRTILRPQLLCNALESTVNLLTPTKPRCPHLGCALKWNAAEHSWDCPCHGSRFGEDGKLLNNPATDDLKK